MSNSSSRLALGTANFGLNYGVANDAGKISDQELLQIINLTEKVGVNMVDTAQAYGDSEQRLGSVLRLNNQIITKIGRGLHESCRTDSVCSLVNESLQRLKRTELYGLLLHRPELLLGVQGPTIIAELKSLKERGLVKKIGVSIYAPDILSELLKLINLDIVQVPFNLFDQRIISSGWSERLKENGTEIHTRSVFLQGLLLMQRQDLNIWFELNWPQLFDSWNEFQKEVGVSVDRIALGFALRQPWIDKIVVGVDNVQQLNNFDPDLAINDVNLIDPSKWKLK